MTLTPDAARPLAHEVLLKDTLAMPDTSKEQQMTKKDRLRASLKRPVPHSGELPIPTLHQLPQLCEDEYCPFDQPSDTNEGDSDYEGMSSSPQVSTRMS
ncbi:hypothetical protein ILUMI_18842 [Ignelater luminosus]|uniref:Uncharacterized protein n=1 Tax=Ignelater luminosus TaxID=2038154 RepID=A0A8K0CH90_IGNLU|nr:hypothetical protein ILUMI_18842 [Ignelater luminosus]